MARRTAKVETSRIVADVPPRVHRALRVYCAREGLRVRDFILKLLAEKGIK